MYILWRLRFSCLFVFRLVFATVCSVLCVYFFLFRSLKFVRHISSFTIFLHSIQYHIRPHFPIHFHSKFLTRNTSIKMIATVTKVNNKCVENWTKQKQFELISLWIVCMLNALLILQNYNFTSVVIRVLMKNRQKQSMTTFTLVCFVFFYFLFWKSSVVQNEKENDECHKIN